jgi:hypothetical protein
VAKRELLLALCPGLAQEAGPGKSTGDAYKGAARRGGSEAANESIEAGTVHAASLPMKRDGSALLSTVRWMRKNLLNE